MTTIRRALVAVDADGSDSELLQYASLLPRLSPEVAISFIHVLGWQAHSPAGESPVTHSQALKKLQDAVSANFAGKNGVCQVLHGNLIDQLLITAAETAVDLILLGHRPEHGNRRALARRLAMKAPCSVWMRPAGGPTDIRRVLAAVDFSIPSAQALSVAAKIASSLGAECLALHAYFDAAVMEESEQQAQRREVRNAFDRFLAPLDVHGVQIRSIIDESSSVVHAVQRLVERENVDLVVMGNRGQTRSASILLGSESEHMLMEAHAPVLVVKRRGERISLLRALLDRDFHLPEGPRFS